MIPFLTTKLFIPPRRPRDSVVERSRLTDRLTAANGQCLTLVSAPAGFGKTTLLSEWIPHSEHCVAWLSLDPSDNDPLRFWAYVITALQTLQSDLGANALALLDSPQTPPIESILTLLLNEVAAFPDRFALVLDDYNVIETPAIHTALTFLLDHLPPNMHLIITSRSDPPLPLARWRVRRQLTEIRAADLRFTSDEAATFLKQVMGLNLSADEITALEAHTEGWIAGLQLAALSMQGRTDTDGFIRSFTGSHAYIIDYLAEEVLQRQPADVQAFLLQTSILDRMCGSLCDAVTERSASQRLLEHLEHSNLFIVSLDDKRDWFRYHSLFADVLQARLRQTRPEVIPELHRRASVWYEQHGSTIEAVDHALAAADFDRTAWLIEQNAWQLIGRGQLTTLQTWLDRLPSAVTQARPRLGLAHATFLSITNQMDALEARLNDVDSALASNTESSPVDREALLGQATALRVHLALEKYEDPLRAVELGRQALTHIPQDNTFMRSLVLYYLGSAQRYSGDAAGAIESFTQGSHLALAAGNPLYTLIFFDTKANVEKAQGKLHQAAATYEQSRKLTVSRGWHTHPNAVNARIGLGTLRYEWNDVEEAAQVFRECLAWTRRGGMRFNQIKTCLLLAALPPTQCDPAEAPALLEEAARLARDWNRPSPLRLVQHNTARLALRWGDLDAAARWAAASGRSADDSVLLYQHEDEYLALARVLIAQGRTDEASRLLDRLLASAEADARMGEAIEILMLRALAFQAGSHIADATAALERALTLAEPEGYIRTFVDEGEPMRLLMSECKLVLENRSTRLQAYVDKLLAVFPAAADLHTSAFIPQPLIEPLSERELEVLRLISDGLSNREIAARLVIGLGTVKTHINNIFGKLNVKNRTQAVARARELNLL